MSEIYLIVLTFFKNYFYKTIGWSLTNFCTISSRGRGVKENDSGLERRIDKLEAIAKYLKENLERLWDELEETQTSTENTENLLKNNNIKLRGLK